MLHIAYIESDRHRQFTFAQIAVLLRANSFDNQLLFYQDIATAIERLPVERPDIVFVDVRARTERRPSGLDLVRTCFALHIAGDQHLGSTVQYGIDDWND